MKKGYLMLLSLLVCSFMAAGYSDSSEIKKPSFQVELGQDTSSDVSEVVVLPVADFSAELPTELFIFAPDLGIPMPNQSTVSEKLAAGFFISVSPPPDKVQKSEFNNENCRT